MESWLESRDDELHYRLSNGAGDDASERDHDKVSEGRDESQDKNLGS